MASIKKDDKTGTYYFVLDLPRDPVTGARKQARRRGFKNKKEAQAAANALYHELTQGTYIANTDMSFQDFSHSFLDYYRKLGEVKPSTMRTREYEVQVLRSYFKAAALQSINRNMYQNALFDMKHTRNLSDNYIKGVHACARMIFKRAMELNLIRNNPTDYAKLPKSEVTVADIEKKNELPKYLEKEELNHFLEVAKQHGLYGDYETFFVMAYTGLRIGEFLALTESDIDFDEHSISVTKTIFNPSQKLTNYQLLPPKTKKSIRVIEVEPEVTQVIRDLIQSNKAIKMLYRRTYHDKGFIAVNREKSPGYPQTDSLISYRMKRLLKLAELNNQLSPHSLRHTHTSLLAESGVTLEEIMDRLGHKDDATTRLVYLHVTKTQKKGAAKKFGELMRSVRNSSGK